MIKEHFKLIELQREHEQGVRDFSDQISSLRVKIAEKYQQGQDDDVVVKEDGRYYIIRDFGRIREINFVESQDG